MRLQNMNIFFGFLIILQAIYVSVSHNIEAEKAVMIEDNTLDASTFENGNIADRIKEYLEHVKEKTIQYTGKNLTKKTTITKTIIKKINAVTNYLLNYLALANGANFVIDKEFLLLNILERAYRLYIIEKGQILEDTLAETNCTNNVCIDKYLLENDLIKNQSRNFKREELQYICKKYKVCRMYPAFTDYLEDLLNELLELPEDRLKTFIEILTKIIMNNYDFLTSFSDMKDKQGIVAEVGSFCNKFGMKKILVLARNVINERYRIVSKRNFIPKPRIQAIRVLLDILDETFQRHYNEKFHDYYDDTMKAIKSWGIGEAVLLKPVLEKFLSNVLSAIVLDHDPMLNALIEIIVRGKSDDKNIDKKMFTPGGKGVF